MDDQDKNYRGIDVETAFGRPDAMERAAAVMATYPVCPETGLHCPWYQTGCTLEVICPELGGESAVG